MSQDAQHNACQRVGQDRYQLVLMYPFVGLRQPGAEAESLTSFGSHRDGLVRLNDQGQQVSRMGYVLQKLINIAVRK
jgi:hypothetical protein